MSPGKFSRRLFSNVRTTTSKRAQKVLPQGHEFLQRTILILYYPNLPGKNGTKPLLKVFIAFFHINIVNRTTQILLSQFNVDFILPVHKY